MPSLRKTSTSEASGTWSVAEHERFLEAMAQYPQGPWRLITEHVGSRSIKQVQTHAQKYQQKLLRHQRGLRKTKTKVMRPEHRVDTSTVDQFISGCIVRKSHTHPHASESTSPSPSSASYSSESPASSSSMFSSMMGMLSEAAEVSVPNSAPGSDVAYYGHGYAYDGYCAPSPPSLYYYDSYSRQGHAGSGVEPMPYSYGYSTAPVAWSEPEAVALRETLEVLLV